MPGTDLLPGVVVMFHLFVHVFTKKKIRSCFFTLQMPSCMFRSCCLRSFGVPGEWTPTTWEKAEVQIRASRGVT